MNPSTVRSAIGSTLAELVQTRAQDTPHRCAFTFLDGDTQFDLSYGELERYARSFALELSAEAQPGDRVLLMYPPGAAYVIALFGCALAGVVPVPLYPPPAHRTLWRVRAILDDAGATLALADRAQFNRLHATEDSLVRGLRLRTFDVFGNNAGSLRTGARPGDVALLQYTSGSTGTPKGVVVTHQNILSNTSIIKEAFAVTSGDVGVFWLPPYHDMGLIGGIIAPLAIGIRAVLLTPLAFLRRPLVWLKTISRFAGTVSGAPNFAYALCAQKLIPERAGDLDLSAWRIAFIGAEPVRATTLEQFTKVFAPWGFRAASFRPCYGLAEATLMVSGVPTGEVPVTVVLDAAALAAGHVVPGGQRNPQVVVGCGETAAALHVVIADPHSRERLPDGRVGEIWVSSPSNAQGYWGRPDDAAFNATLSDGKGPYLRTGDTGFLLERELFVTGRCKEVIIVNGRNLYPHDIEEAACGAHPALDPDASVAFPIIVKEQEEVVFAAELRSTDVALRREAADNVRQALVRELDVALYDVRFVPPGAIPRTSSGKVRRLAMRDKYYAEALSPNAMDSSSRGEMNPLDPR